MLFIWLIVVNTLTAFNASLISPYFPPLADERGVSDKVIGIIIALPPIGSFITSIILAEYLTKENRLYIMFLGLTLQIIELSSYILMYWIENSFLLCIVAMIARIMQGVGVSCLQIPIFALIPVFYPNDIEKKVSFLEMSWGLGFTIGPLIGGLLFDFAGYLGPFIVFSGLLLGSTPLLYSVIKKHLVKVNPDNQETINPSNDQVIENQEKIPFLSVITCATLMVFFFVNMISTYSYMYFEPIQANYLMKSYDLNNSNAGYIIALPSFTYILGTLIFGHLKLPKRQLQFCGIFITSLTFFFQGPDPRFTHIDHNLVIIIIVQGVLGFSCAMMFIPSLPLFNETLLSMYPDYKEQAGNMAASLFNASGAIGELLGPVVGGFFTDYFGYTEGSSLMGLIMLGIWLLYLFIFCMKAPKRQFIYHKEQLEAVV